MAAARTDREPGEEMLTLSQRERDRLAVLHQVKEGLVGDLIGVSARGTSGV